MRSTSIPNEELERRIEQRITESEWEKVADDANDFVLSYFDDGETHSTLVEVFKAYADYKTMTSYCKEAERKRTAYILGRLEAILAPAIEANVETKLERGES